MGMAMGMGREMKSLLSYKMRMRTRMGMKSHCHTKLTSRPFPHYRLCYRLLQVLLLRALESAPSHVKLSSSSSNNNSRYACAAAFPCSVRKWKTPREYRQKMAWLGCYVGRVRRRGEITRPSATCTRTNLHSTPTEPVPGLELEG